MKGSFLRHIALNMAFLQVFVPQVLKFNKLDYKLEKNTYENVELLPGSSEKDIIPVDKKKLVYKRKDKDTGEYKTISIFDFENIESDQYGADQIAFKKHFDELIKDPLIYEEVQKYFPVTDFDSEEDANIVYQEYFEILNKEGCGYEAGINFLFRLFEGREEEFYNTFGFPMYTIKDETIDFNYELCMLKFFNRVILKDQETYNKIKQALIKHLYEIKLEKYVQNRDSKYSTKNIENWSEKEYQKYLEYEEERKNTINEYQKIINSVPRINYNDFAVNPFGAFGDINFFLSEYGIVLNIYKDNETTEPQPDEILVAKNFKMYHVDIDGNIDYETKSKYHYVYVSEITDDGLIIVSSYGNMYIYDINSTTYTDGIILKLSK